MTKLQDAREFRKDHILPELVKNGMESLNIDRLLVYHSKHNIRKVLEHAKANEDKPMKLFIEWLESKLN